LINKKISVTKIVPPHDDQDNGGHYSSVVSGQYIKKLVGIHAKPENKFLSFYYCIRFKEIMKIYLVLLLLY